MRRGFKSVNVMMVALLVLMTAACGDGASKDSRVKNVIVMVPDGFSAAYATNYRNYIGGQASTLDEILVGMAKTRSLDHFITDSAAAASAMATGNKVQNGAISMTADGKALKTVLEGAIEANKATGMVVTSTLSHATPGAFSSHANSRVQELEIAAQLIGKVDVLLGGGKNLYSPEDKKRAEELGYLYLENRDQLLEANHDKLFGLFAGESMTPEIDRDAMIEPSLEEMTNKALEVLAPNKNGFFLLVEGSQIDYAGHVNDAAWAMREIEAFERAVKSALEFAKENGDTLLIIAGDHDTGGMTVGNVDSSYSIDLLHHVKASGAAMIDYWKRQDQDLKEVVHEYAQVELNDDEIRAIEESHYYEATLNQIISDRAGIIWITLYHTGVDVPVYAYGPGSSKLFGVIDNTDIAKVIAQSIGFDLESAEGVE